MTDDYVTVAGFGETVEAEIARGRLESEGIPAVVSGAPTANVLFGTTNLGRVELRVPAEHLKRAVQILVECGGGRNLSEEVREDDEEPVWLCPLCGEPVRDVLPVCHACHTPRGKSPTVRARYEEDEPEDGIQAQPAAASREIRRPEDGIRQPAQTTSEPPVPHDSAGVTMTIDGSPAALSEGDTMARRALYGALFAFPTAGLLLLYSIWLLLRLTFHRGELSARGMRHLYLAMVLDGLYLVLFLLLCGGIR